MRDAHPAPVRRAVAALSCNREPAAADPAADKPTVALVLKTLNHPFFVDMRRGAQEAADRLGVTLQVQAAEREIDVDKQMQIVENLIQTGIKVALHHAERLARDRLRARQGARCRHADHRRRHAGRREGRGRGRRADADLRRLRQLRGRQARRRARASRQPAARRGSASSRASPATRPAIRGCADSATPSPARPG